MKIKITFLLAIIFLLASCTKDFLDINEDPNNPTTAPHSQLLTSAEQQLSHGLALGDGFTASLSVYMHQLSSREEMNQYSLTGSEWYITYPWTLMYAAPIEDLEAIIRNATESDDMIYVGIAKILKAYSFSVLVDLFGDMPYSEANKAIEENYYPVWDDDAVIYPQLLSLIDEGLSNILDANSLNLSIPGTDDIIYQGDTAKWIKAGKTIKLKLLNQIRLTENVASQVNALLNEDLLISSNDENLALPYGTKTNPDDRHPGYQEYEVGQKGNYISPWFYEILMGYNPARFTGIVDPRIPYYFYNQLLPGDDTREGNPWEYRDGGFISIVFGSIGTNRDHSTDRSMTVLGLYPVGGRYDDGGAIAVRGTSATGDAPFRFITYADRLYIEAELMQAGIITGDARTKLEEAMYESFDLVDWVVNSTTSAQAIPTLLGSGSDTTYIDAVLAEYDAEDAEGQMEIIMTEKWISSFGNSVDQYTDYRRTGYPILFDPNNSTQAPNREIVTPEGVIVPVRLNNPFQLSLPWSDDDININPNAPAQKKPGEYRVFWDVN